MIKDKKLKIKNYKNFPFDIKERNMDAKKEGDLDQNESEKI